MAEIGKTYRNTKTGAVGIAVQNATDDGGEDAEPVVMVQLRLVPGQPEEHFDMRWHPGRHLELYVEPPLAEQRA